VSVRDANRRAIAFRLFSTDPLVYCMVASTDAPNPSTRCEVALQSGWVGNLQLPNNELSSLMAYLEKWLELARMVQGRM